MLSLSMIYALDTSIGDVQTESAGATTAYPTVGPACVEIVQGKLFKQADETTFDQVIFVPTEVTIIDSTACASLRGKDYSNIAPIIPAYSLDKVLTGVQDKTLTTITSKILLSYDDFYTLLAKNTEKISAKAKTTIDQTILTHLKNMDTANKNMIALSSVPKALFTANKLAFPDPTRTKKRGEVYLSLIPGTASANPDTSDYANFYLENMILEPNTNSNAALEFTSFKINSGNQEVLITLNHILDKTKQDISLKSDKKLDFYLDNINLSKTDYLYFKQVKEVFYAENEIGTSIYLKTDGLDINKPTDIYYYFPNGVVVFPDKNGEVDIFVLIKNDESAVNGISPAEKSKGFVIFTPKKVLLDRLQKIEIKGKEITQIILDQGDSLYYGYPNDLNVIKNLEREPLKFEFGSSDKLFRFKSDWTVELAGSKSAENDLFFTFNDFSIFLEKGVNRQNTQLSLIPAIIQNNLVSTSKIVGMAAHKEKIALASEVDQIIISPTGSKKQIGPYGISFKFDEAMRIRDLIEAAEKLELIQKEKDTTQAKEIAHATLPKVEIPVSPEPKLQEIQTDKVKIIKATTVAASNYDSCKTSFSEYSCMTPYSDGRDITQPITPIGNYKYECKINKDCKDNNGDAAWCCPSAGFETRCCIKTALKLPSAGDRLQPPLESITENLKAQISISKNIFPSSGIINLKDFKMEYPQADASSTSTYKPNIKLGTGYTYINEFEANGKTYYKVRNPEGKILIVGTKENGDPDMAPALYGTIVAMPSGAIAPMDNTNPLTAKVQSLSNYYKSRSFGVRTAALYREQYGGTMLSVPTPAYIFRIDLADTKAYILYDKNGEKVGHATFELDGLRLRINQVGGYIKNRVNLELLNSLKIGITEKQVRNMLQNPNARGEIGSITYTQATK